MKRAFTLMELLVVLAILGVIASLVMSSVLNIIPNENRVKFRKGFATISNVISEVTNNTRYYPDSDPSIPILTDPNTADADVIAQLQRATGNAIASDEQFFCATIAASLNLIPLGGANIACDLTAENAVSLRTPDGITFYNLAGPFNQDNNTRKFIYMAVSSKEAHPVGGAVAGDFAGRDVNNPAVFRFKLEKTGRIIVDDVIEQEYLTEVSNVKWRN